MRGAFRRTNNDSANMNRLNIACSNGNTDSNSEICARNMCEVLMRMIQLDNFSNRGLTENFQCF